MKKTAFILFIISSFFFERATAQRVISGVRFEFNTTKDDKDHDTGFELYLKTSNNNVIASGNLSQGANVYYGNNTNNKFSLTVNGSYTENDLSRAKIDITIFPTGHDTWDFDLYIVIIFTDGSESSYTSNAWSLSQDSTTNETNLP